jgi:hypothetical protein
MPFDSNGVFTRVMNWTSDQQNGIAIECGRHDQEDDNFAEGFNDTFCRDGRAAATGDFNLGGHKIKNLADGVASTDAVNKGQMDSVNSTLTALISTSTSTAVSNLLTTLYPVGSIYIGTQNTCPLSSLIAGSTWELVATDRALWGGNGSNANSTINAGLPNITGAYNARCFHYSTSQGAAATGALYQATSGYGEDWRRQNAGGTDGSNMWPLVFDASRSNSIYGASSTVQPPAYRVNVWRRTA